MSIPFVIDNQKHRLQDALNELLVQSVGKPLYITRTEPSTSVRNGSRTKTSSTASSTVWPPWRAHSRMG